MAFKLYMREGRHADWVLVAEIYSESLAHWIADVLGSISGYEFKVELKN